MDVYQSNIETNTSVRHIRQVRPSVGYMRRSEDTSHPTDLRIEKEKQLEERRKEKNTREERKG